MDAVGAAGAVAGTGLPPLRVHFATDCDAPGDPELALTRATG